MGHPEFPDGAEGTHVRPKCWANMGHPEFPDGNSRMEISGWKFPDGNFWMEIRGWQTLVTEI
jgi:hypothetical protein